MAWADEEYGAHTDDAYVRRFVDDLGHMLCAINMDGIGLLPETTTLAMLAQSDAFEAAVRDISGRYPAITWVVPGPPAIPGVDALNQKQGGRVWPPCAGIDVSIRRSGSP